MQKASCIIPMYDEAERPLGVLKLVTQIKSISQIICVDDGSQDDISVNMIEKNYPQVEIVRLLKNQGKSAAVFEGLKKVTNNIVVLLDSDIAQLDINILENAINTFVTNNLDMITFKTTITHLIERFLRGNIIVSGQRIIRKNYLIDTFNIYRPKRYQLELAMNQYMLDNKKKISIINFPITAMNKSKKWGFFYGWYKDIQMQFNLLDFGVGRWFKQYKYFFQY